MLFLGTQQPPSVPTPTKARTSGQSVTTNDLIVNAAYHSVMSSANTEPYAVPTSQRPPPPQQQAIRPARVSLDYRRADQPPLALIEDAPPMEESVDTSATGTKQCEAITNVAIRIMRIKGIDEQQR